jgi:hypothetical protein
MMEIRFDGPGPRALPETFGQDLITWGITLTLIRPNTEDLMKKLLGMFFSVLFLGLTACGPKAFVKGEYDDVNRENLLNDQWSETDMQKAVNDLVGSMMKSAVISKAKTPPVVMVTGLQNKTSEHIDTQSIMDMIRVELMKSGQVTFIDKEARQDIADEYNYQNSGMTAEESKKGPGGQVGADYIINGRLDSITQEVGKDKSVYYKLTLNLTNLKSSVINWSDNKQIRKTFKKKTIGL